MGILGRDQWRPCNGYGLVRDYLKLGPAPSLVFNVSNTTARDPDYLATATDYTSDPPAQSLEVFDLFTTRDEE